MSPHPLGRENLGSKEDLLNAITQMRAKKPSIKQVLAKLNEGVSGEGNAIVDLNGLPLGRRPVGTARCAAEHRSAMSLPKGASSCDAVRVRGCYP